MEFPGIQKIKLFHVIIVIFIACGLLFPAGHVVIAQDIPPSGGTEEAPVVVDNQPPADPPAENPPTGDPTADPPAENQPVVDPTADPSAPQEPALTEVPLETDVPAVPTDTAPVTDPTENVPQPVETPAETPVEIIAAASEMGVTLVDGEGDPLVMADEETSELLTSGDPYYIATFGVRRFNGTWQTLPVYEAYAKVAGGCIANSANYTVHCNVSANPIQEAINAASPLGRVVHIEAGDYSTDNLVISSAVTFRTTADIVVNQITLNSGANVNFFNSILLRTGTYTGTNFPFTQVFSNSQTLTAPSIFLNEGALLSDAVELVANNGKINISAGTFNRESAISINKSVEIEGQGAGNTIIMSNEAALLPVSSLLIANADNIIIHGLTLTGRNPGGSNDIDSYAGIRDTGAFTNLTVYDTTIQDFFLYGIQVTGNKSFDIHNNVFQNIRGINNINLASGIRVATDRGLINFQNISGNTFTGNDFGVSIQDSNVLLIGNNFTGNTNGIRIDDLDAGDAVNLRYNRIVGNTTGIVYNHNYSYDPAVTSTLEWWGCNGGPGTAGCDTTAGNFLSVPIYLMFGLAADPTSVYTGETSDLTAFMYSAGDPTSVVDNSHLPWFTPPAPSMTGTVFGSLTGNTFMGGGTTGTQFFSATFDNALATATVDVLGDTDGDKVENGVDNCPAVSNPDQVDTDEDGYGNECDLTPTGDDDEDGIDNRIDNCRYDPNNDQADRDEDFVGDVCDPTPNGDWDEDRIDNLTDNCPETWNNDQLDSDHDGTGDVCDATPNGNPVDPPNGGGNGPAGVIGLIPVTGGLGKLSCTEAATLALPGGDRVTFSDPLCEYEAVLSKESAESLLVPLPDGKQFLSAVNLVLQKDGNTLGATPSPVTYTLSFMVPENYKGKTLTLFFWDAAANGGVGGWTEVPVKIGENGMAEATGLTITGFYVLAFQ